MKREIKFRGKTYSGKWVYGYFLHDGQRGRYVITDGLLDIDAVNSDTVGQFTGLVDKKGNKIFEGDILYSEFSDKSGGYSLVGWNDKTSSFGIMDEYSYRSIADGYDFAEFKNYVLLAHLKDAIICEVVGNIYDNKELLDEHDKE